MSIPSNFRHAAFRLFKGASLGLFWTMSAALALFAAANLRVLLVGNRVVIADPARLPRHSTGLVLGTSPRTQSAGPNPFFEGRMNAAARLYHEGILDGLLLSGDNRRSDYNEPAAMRDALIARGLPVAALTLDNAGIRTLDSVTRAQKVFHAQSTVIITDDFHLPRALFIASEIGLPAVGFASDPVPFARSFRTRLRETLSRARACLDVYFWNTRPLIVDPPAPAASSP
ncbi:MAG: ElyC/SanA/YdcF family protein [Verrucomicrobiota bacterium]